MCRKIRQVLRRVEQKVHAAVSEFLKLTALERKDSEVYFRRLFANGTHDWRKMLMTELSAAPMVMVAESFAGVKDF
ncbi:MAG: hypothetical protein ACLT49_05255 [Sutterella wadsworthensis]